MIAAACGSDSKDDDDGIVDGTGDDGAGDDGTGDDGGATDDGATVDAGADGTAPDDGDDSAAPGRSPVGTCYQSESECSMAAQDVYVNCLLDKCGSEIEAAKAGPCAEFYGCTVACDCGDTACEQACGVPTTDCQAVAYAAQGCFQQCPPPACGS